MPDPVVKVLDTAGAGNDTGDTQTAKAGFLKKNIPVRFTASIGAGDTVVIEGKSDSGESFETLHSFTDDTPADIYLSLIWRARRSVDGGGADSEIFVENNHNQNITAHD